jgi:glycosyltransferase involved in cell wall biosynthesis
MLEKICILPQVHGIGGMVSFFHKFCEGAAKQGVEVTTNVNDPACSALLIIGGTKDLAAIYQFRKKGKKVAQRLDGLNWIHQVRPISFRHSLRAEYGNFVLKTIRRHLCDEIVYQSEFSRTWWNERFGAVEKPSTVIYNGVDLQTYTPKERPTFPPFRVLVVEGSMGGGYESGLENAILLTKGLLARNMAVELQVVGEVEPSLQKSWESKIEFPILWTGKVPRERIPEIDRGAHVLFSADIHPACPNSVMEAMACGLPVVSYNTGSLNELVTDDCGQVVAYGSNSWRLENPIIDNLVDGAEMILKDWDRFSKNSRQRAEDLFGLELMVNKYLDILLG